jgi:hypothetical protein
VGFGFFRSNLFIFFPFQQILSVEMGIFIFQTVSPIRKVENSLIFICLTPNPKGEHLKIIELGSPPFGG